VAGSSKRVDGASARTTGRYRRTSGEPANFLFFFLCRTEHRHRRIDIYSRSAAVFLLQPGDLALSGSLTSRRAPFDKIAAAGNLGRPAAARPRKNTVIRYGRSAVSVSKLRFRSPGSADTALDICEFSREHRECSSAHYA